MSSRRGFGRIEKRASGRYRASYTGPDAVLHRSPETFETKVDAKGWLASLKRDIDLGMWEPVTAVQAVREERQPAHRTTVVTFGDYDETWLAERTLRALHR